MKQFIINNVFKIINYSGYDAWFVGSCVRHKLLGLHYNNFDICTNCPLEAIMAIFDKIVNIFKNTYYNIYIVNLIIKDSKRTEHIDITILCPLDLTKTDEYNSLIKINPLSNYYNDVLLVKDSLRRNFTINTLYEDINGKIIDPTGLGISDLRNNILRFVGEDYKTKLINDPFIMFRFIRFLSTKNLTSFESLESIKQISENLDYNKISNEHKLSELIKIISGKNWMNSYFYNYFEASGICKFLGFDKIIESLKSCNQSYEFHLEGSVWKNKKTQELKNGEEIDNFTDWTPIKQGNVFDHTILTIKNICKLLGNDPDKHKRFILNMSAFLHEIGKSKFKEIYGEKNKKYKINNLEIEETNPIVYEHDFISKYLVYDFCKSLKINIDDCKLIKYLVDNYMKILQLNSFKSPSQIFKFVKQKNFEYLLILAQADEMASIPINKLKNTIRQIMEHRIVLYLNGEFTLTEISIKNLTKMNLPKCVLTKKDLLDIGIKNNELIEKMLDKTLDIQINEGITNKKILLDKIKNEVN